MNSRTKLSQIWTNIQYTLFPVLEEDIGPISPKHKKLIAVLELVRIEHFLVHRFCRGMIGRPPKNRIALARAYVAKVILKLEFTNQLRDYLLSDKQLRRICGWTSIRQIPSESTFSRAFEEFAASKLPESVHTALIKDLYEDQIIGHVTKDSTPIEAREKPVRSPKKLPEKRQAKQKERPKRGKVREKELTRIERQLVGNMSVQEMLEELPTCCNIGKKKGASGHHRVWHGYKLHVATDDHCVPLAAIVTSASLQDNQVAIPLAIKANEVAKNFYDLMDSIYDVKGILAHSRLLGHVPLVEMRPATARQKRAKLAEEERRRVINWKPAEAVRYGERRKSERFNALFKDYYGGRKVHYRGYLKASCYLMFGVLTLAASLLLDI